MTIRLSHPHPVITESRVSPGRMYYVETAGGTANLATADTLAEAESARLALERALLPRFTADEAIAIVKAATAGVRSDYSPSSPEWSAYLRGVRATLEALAAAGVFVPDEAAPCPECRGVGVHKLQCSRRGRVPQTMAEKLDAAGIV